MSKQIWRAGNMLYPVPAALVSVGRYEKAGDEKNCNMLTVAWTGTVCSSPAMTYISVRPERYSYPILKETGEFVINLTTVRLARVTDMLGVKTGAKTDKFQLSGLTAGKASVIHAPLIQESPVNIECQVTQVIPLGSHDMFIGEVVSVMVRKDLLDEEGKLHLEKAGLIAYSHGLYQKLGDVIGFFGWSVAREDVFERRMKNYR